MTFHEHVEGSTGLARSEGIGISQVSRHSSFLLYKKREVNHQSSNRSQPAAPFSILVTLLRDVNNGDDEHDNDDDDVDDDEGNIINKYTTPIYASCRCYNINIDVIIVSMSSSSSMHASVYAEPPRGKTTITTSIVLPRIRALLCARVIFFFSLFCRRTATT